MLLYQKQQQEKLADMGRKQLEALLSQLQEQLQLNLFQQTQLMQQRSGTGVSAADRRKNNELAQTLAGQQQQIIHQIQLTHQHFVLGSVQQNNLLTSPPTSAGRLRNN
jgi:predicted amidophosphoribosyltransferase